MQAIAYPSSEDLLPLPQERPGTTNVQAVVNLVAGGLGTGMFSLPWSMAGASVLPGIGMTVAVVAMNAGTIMVLVFAADRHQVFDLGSLLGLLPGRPGRLLQAFSNVMVWVVLCGSLTSYIIVIHDSAHPFVRGTFLRFRFPMVLLASILVLPLCFVSQRHLANTSILATIVNVYLIALLFFKFSANAVEERLPGDSCILGLGTGSIAMVANLAQCIIIQMCVLPMYEKLQIRTPANFSKVLAISFTCLAVIFALFTTFGYLLFGPDVHPNALTNLHPGPFNDLAQLGTICVVVAIYPLMVIPMVAPIRKLNSTWFAAPGTPEPIVRWRKKRARIIVKLGIVFVSFVGALLVTELSLVNVIGGALSVWVFSTMGPAAAGLYLLERSSFQWRVSMHVLAYVGVILAVLGFIFNDNYKDELAKSCMWYVSDVISAQANVSGVHANM